MGGCSAGGVFCGIWEVVSCMRASRVVAHGCLLKAQAGVVLGMRFVVGGGVLHAGVVYGMHSYSAWGWGVDLAREA